MSKYINLEYIKSMRPMWKAVNAEALPEEEKILFLKRKEAVDFYIDGMRSSDVREQTGILPQELSRLLKRCMLMDKDNNFVGYQGLLPRNHIIKKIGEFEKLVLAFPELEDYILGNYFGDKKYTLEHNMTYSTLHSKFLQKCMDLGVQTYEYPFNTQKKGYNALIDFVKKKQTVRSSKAITRESRDAKQKFSSTGFGASNSLLPIQPYNVVQIDGHKIDMLYSVKVENVKGEVEWKHAIRPWLICVIDVASRAILGYHITSDENYNQYDVLKAIKNCIEPHKRINLRPAFSYPEGGGFPSECCPSLAWASFDMIMLDNAKAHLAEKVVSKLTEQLRCAVNFGSVATPESRGIVERFFGTLERNGYHRLPGTTGSNTRDTKRKDPEMESAKYQITYEDIVEITEYLIATYNTSAHSSLQGETPLQVIKRRYEQARLKPHILEPQKRENLKNLLYYFETRKLQGGYDTGEQPRLNFMKVVYRAEDCKIPMNMIGEEVNVEINPDDISHLNIYTKKGVYIAKMVASGEWGRRVHSIQTRKLMLKNLQDNTNINDPFMPIFSKFEEELKGNGRKSARARTQAEKISREENKQDFEEKQKAVVLPPIPATDRYGGFTKEEYEALKNESIESLYNKGVL